ncbi:MAG: alpha/beta hydrolase [Candidatus Promineifilaceae bacterium]|nr:alpha/beta hydrolase [Candidatus Promineifilaceae bacterium]
MEEQFITLSETTVFGMAAGDPSGPLILGIHGWSQRNGWHTWEPLMTPLADAGYYVVSVDMPGWGKSPAIDDKLLLGPKAAETLVGIIESLQKVPAVLMGKSWGGDVAVSTALRFPVYVSHLILTAPAIRDYEKLTSLTQPVLLAWAGDDPVISIDNADRFVAAARDVQLVTYARGGHSAAPRNAADFSKRAIDFLFSEQESGHERQQKK